MSQGLHSCCTPAFLLLQCIQCTLHYPSADLLNTPALPPPLQVALGAAMFSLPETFTLQVPSSDPTRTFDTKTVKNWHMFICVAVGLWGGLLIGLVTEYYTSNRYKPVQVGGQTGQGNRYHEHVVMLSLS